MATNGSFTWNNYTANANVRPKRVCTGVTGAGNALKAIEATASSQIPVGISKDFTRYQPGSPADDGFIAIATEPLPIAGPGEIVSALAGAAITDARQPLVSDSTGRLISLPTATGSTTITVYWCVAWPHGTALAANDTFEVLTVQPFPISQYSA